VHGRSSGGDLVVLGGAPASDLLESLEPFALTGRGGGRDVPSDLVDAADAAHASATAANVPLVLVSHDLRISPVALLDVLDGPRDVTTAAVVDGPVTDRRGAGSDDALGGFTPVRVDPVSRRVVSVGTVRHVVSGPTTYAAGVLRVAAADRVRVAEVLRAAATSQSAQEPGMQSFDLALLAVVRDAAVPVAALPLAHVTVERGHEQRSGAAGSAWQQRLRAASRGNDGVFSTHAIRPLSRRLTAYGLGRGWTPNVVTFVSLLLGLAACALAAVDTRWTWVLAAVLLQASLVVDCVDGEIARFTRRYSPLGGWLDAVSDRIKEFSLVAAVAWVAARRGDDLWWLAIVVLTLLAARHVEDFAYATRHRALSARPVVPRAVDVPGDGGSQGARTEVPPAPTGRARVVRDVKQVLHLPIAERYLVMSVGLLVHSPAFLLWALGIASAVAFAWTQVGRLGKAVTGRDRFRADQPDPTLPHLVDLAVVPRPSGRGRLAWQVPGLLVAVEAAALLLAAGEDPAARGAAYAWLAAVCWHVYDNVYRLRETGRGTPHALVRATLGVEGRVVVLAVIGGLTDRPAVPLLVGALLLFVAYAAESARAWRAVIGSAPADAASSRTTRQDGSS
jgi:phosphatidylglycerophosphate synthase